MLSGAMLVLLSSALAAQGGTAAPAAPAKAPALKWGPAPAVFAHGAQMAVVSGDPSKAENFVIQLKMPNGYKIAPHFHPTDETVEVKSGKFMYGMGDTMKAADMKTMDVGQSGTLPAGSHHYAQAKGATVVQVSAMGPFALTYVNPADDPSKAPMKATKAPAKSR
jgi:quercetin dioxygenase-like cupin family protein